MSNEFELDPMFLVVQCGRCEAKLRVRSNLAGKIGTCPKCQSALPIPKLVDYCDETEPVDSVDAGEGYGLATALEHEPDEAGPVPLPKELVAPPPEHGYLAQLGQVRKQATTKRPKWTFFSGVFDFPWHDGVWPRWIWLVVGGISISVIPVLAISVLEGASGYGGVALAFFAMPQIWLTIWTGAYAASCGLQVFEDTAAGSQQITSWPDPNWREWTWALMQQVYVAFMVFAAAFGLGKAAGLTGGGMYLLIGSMELLLFPVAFLSVLEANSLLVLISPSVAWTLLSKPASWGTFYALITAMSALWYGVLYFGCGLGLIVGMLLNGFLFGTFVLIYFRLLGRLAWSISHQHRKKTRRA